MSNDTDSTIEQVRRRRTAASDQEYKDAVRRLTPAGTQEVANVIGHSRQAADHRLRKLEDEGTTIWSKKVGPTRVWMHREVLAPA